MILRVDARSATAQENTSHAVTRPRMVAELDVTITDPGSFWYSGAAASLLLDGGFCLVIEHQQDQLVYQQMVIDEAGAARTPVLQYAQEYIGKPVDLRIGNEPETLAVDEKLCAELVNVEAESVARSAFGRHERAPEKTSRTACVHADDAHEKSSNPMNGLEIWRRFLEEWEPAHRGRYRAMLMQLLQFPFVGDRGQALEEWERSVQKYEAQNVDTLRDTIKAATLAHNTQDSEWCRCVRLSATRLQEYDALKSMWKEKGKSKREGKEEGKSKDNKSKEGTSDTVEHEMLFLQGKGSSQVPENGQLRRKQ